MKVHPWCRKKPGMAVADYEDEEEDEEEEDEDEEDSDLVRMGMKRRA